MSAQVITELQWTRIADGEWTAAVKTEGGATYEATAKVDNTIDGWLAVVTCGTRAVYAAEFMARDHARRECQHAILRAIALREGPVDVRPPPREEGAVSR